MPAPEPLPTLLKTLERTLFRSGFEGIQIDRPIFIVGLPRSGTSILYELLSSHEDAAYVTTSINSFPEAIRSIEWLRKKFRFNIRGERFLQDSIVADFNSPSEPALFWGKWIGRDVDTLYWQEMRKKDLPQGKTQEIYSDIQKVIASFDDFPPSVRRSSSGSRRFFCKYPVFQTELRLIQDLFPDAYFVHIVRDGRPTANSLVKLHGLMNDQIRKIKHPSVKYLVPYPRTKNLKSYIDQFGADDIRCTAHVWKESIETVRQVQGDLKNFVEIRYEDILKNPEPKIRELFEKLNMPFPRKENRYFHELLGKVGVIHHTNRYGQYEVVEEIAGDLLRELGYL